VGDTPASSASLSGKVQLQTIQIFGIRPGPAAASLTNRRLIGAVLYTARVEPGAQCIVFGLDVLITHAMPHARINKAFDLMYSGEAIRTVVTY
jgi:Zn-dependent alcohol dehydrogenase